MTSRVDRIERARRGRLAVSVEQLRELKKLSVAAGVVMPHVYSMAEATDAIKRLKDMVEGQPELPGFRKALGSNARQPTLGPRG